MNFGSRLKYVIETLHLSYNKFAKKIGVPPSSVSKWITEQMYPSSKSLMAMYEHFGINPGYLLTGQGPVFLRNRTVTSPQEEITLQQRHGQLLEFEVSRISQDVIKSVSLLIAEDYAGNPFFLSMAKRLLTFAVSAYDYLERQEGRIPQYTISKLREICGYAWVSQASKKLNQHIQENPEIKHLAKIGEYISRLSPEKFEESFCVLFNFFDQICKKESTFSKILTYDSLKSQYEREHIILKCINKALKGK